MNFFPQDDNRPEIFAAGAPSSEGKEMKSEESPSNGKGLSSGGQSIYST
ncbi:MAG: hypothetical protein ACK56F_26915 [bacterium]